jgi:signal transduction histidine kinase
MRFSLGFSGRLDNLGEALNINLYRIVQEAVTNALRHSQATAIEISLERLQNDAVQLTIGDNGIGMIVCNVDQTQHFGLLGMRERVQSLRGRFRVDSAPGNGTRIVVELPA